ncbi:hypothetical protein HNV11_05010 [Spirosoma taeanense]|uniref:Peroxidase n=1 Tax=Spirosoma taeanense TaxID=2735870 RepID=A0A6M5Y5V4_9BACT|nr:hypothetical protein [Spirosoma taeanense]QJW88786.1 hypothetical protein HNV11_05010 [Spirosoma taeanense]
MKPFTDQLALTVIAPIDEAKRASLETILAAIEADVEANLIIPFKQLPGVHFARLVILPAFTDNQNRTTPAQLAYSCNFDTSLDVHLQEITSPATLAGFHRVFGCCTGYNASGSPEKAIRQFVHNHKQPIQTFYRGHRGMSVSQIQDENGVRTLIQEYLEQPQTANQTANQLKAGIDAYIARHKPGWRPTADVKLPHLAASAVKYVGIGLLVLLFVLIGWLLGWWGIVGFLLAVALGVLYLRYLEKKAIPLSEGDITFEDVEALTEREDLVVQNQLTHLIELQPGLFRRSLQRLALGALQLLATYTYNQGRLGDIGTIHFARWLLIDRGKRLLFFSNFDGSWENYLGDFVDRAAVGLTLAWSNTQEFPRTRFLILDGATDEERFKQWTRKHQILTQVWYSAYKGLTVKNIIQNHAIVRGIGQPMTPRQTADWLTLL